MPGENTFEARGETFFLNLRFLLIVTVFASNAIEPLISRESAMHTLYMWIFSFHMPLFVLVTGYFAKKTLTGAAGRKVLTQIALQYVIFQSLYSLLDGTFFHVPGIHRSFFAPYLLLWFLASHAFWRLLLLMMRSWKPGARIAFALAAGVMVGYVPFDGVWLSVSRTFVYLPFFVIGYQFSFPALQAIVRRHYRIAAVAGAALLFGFFASYGSGLPIGWMFGSMTYAELGHGEWYAGVFRIGMYVLQLAASAAFIGLVPAAAGAITEWGRRTLYVFLLHGFIIRFAAISGIYASMSGAAGAAIVLATALALTILLAQPFVRRVMHPLVEPPVDWALSLQWPWHRSAAEAKLPQEAVVLAAAGSQQRPQ